MKVSEKDKAGAALVRKLFEDGGAVLCKECSVLNWDIYHTPGNPCPKRLDAANERSSEEK